MKTKQHHFLNNKWIDQASDLNPGKCQLVLVFGAPECVIKPEIYQHLKKSYPKADIVIASTAGEIIDDIVYDDSVVVTALEFEKTEIKCVETNISNHINSFDTGSHLMKQLYREDLRGVFIIADGTILNGTELVAGFSEGNYKNIPITGGLAGDAARFAVTFTGMNETPAQGNVIAVGFYGDNILIGHGSLGGWDEFGQERVITRSEQNILFEIDGKNALELYKEYLGDYASELPGSALLFPLSIKVDGSDKNLIRTVLGVSDEEKTMTFAGNLPEGSKARLMKANFDRLIGASSIAAEGSLAGIKDHAPQFAVLMTCIGRKLVLKDRTEEEVEAAREVLGNDVRITGFYSYGEISPLDAGSQCQLHNQTMSVITFAEF
ncbi:MAG TPA: FIST N-terminal domain-containing protein [Mucilaginibacter sp.]|jgi:hypothetical protein